MREEVRKKVDEDWKDKVEKEKQEATKNNEPYNEPTFNIFVSSLSMQAMIAMGKLENPLTNKKEKNLQQARYLIDTLAMLGEKTKGNLTKEEENFMRECLFNLRMTYLNEGGAND